MSLLLLVVATYLAAVLDAAPHAWWSAQIPPPQWLLLAAVGWLVRSEHWSAVALFAAVGLLADAVATGPLGPALGTWALCGALLHRGATRPDAGLLDRSLVGALLVTGCTAGTELVRRILAGPFDLEAFGWPVLVRSVATLVAGAVLLLASALVKSRRAPLRRSSLLLRLAPHRRAVSR
jgi:rod shape-determining protein MreD